MRARQFCFACQIVYWITLQPYQRLKLPDSWETWYCPPWPLYKQGVAFALVAGPRRPDVGLYRPPCTSLSSIGSFGGAKVMHPSLASIPHCTFKEAKWNFRDLSIQVRYQYVELSIIVQCTRKVRNPCSLDDFTENVKTKVKSCGVWICLFCGQLANMFKISYSWNKLIVFCIRCGAVVEALRHKPESSGIDSRWCHWNYSLT
jgi:hypothetical protein